MSLLDIILLAIALAMDCFTVSIVSGVILMKERRREGELGSAACYRRDARRREGDWSQESGDRRKDTGDILRMAFLFGFFQAMLPLLGWLGISHFQSYMEAYDHWIAFLMLAFIGGKMIKESFGPEEEQHFDPSRLHTQLLLAIATSIDALAIGISFACTGFTELSQLTMPLLIIGIVSFLFSIIGYHLGRRFGKTITRRMKPELLGGIILILIGVKILITHVF